MLDAWLGLSWQFQILVLEAPISVLLGVAICMSFAGRLRPPWWSAFGLAWNTAVLLLFVYGGATSSWQHWGYVGWYLMDSVLVVKNAGKPIDDINKISGPSLMITCIIIIAIPLFLLLTGV